jgi:hypothetical protein
METLTLTWTGPDGVRRMSITVQGRTLADASRAYGVVAQLLADLTKGEGSDGSEKET